MCIAVWRGRQNAERPIRLGGMRQAMKSTQEKMDTAYHSWLPSQMTALWVTPPPHHTVPALPTDSLWRTLSISIRRTSAKVSANSPELIKQCQQGGARQIS